jgi:23S rRNA pseudouridine1911/1915/1917 synthase
VKAGEVIEIHLDGLPLEIFDISEQGVLFRDNFLVALNKPSGVETQPTPARFKGTLYEALLRYLRDPWRPRDEPSLGMVQRLDRETSGVLVFSIHPRAHGPLTEAFSGRAVRKFYLALVLGTPRENQGEIRSLLARNRATNRMRSVERGGKDAITRYRLLEPLGSASLIEVEILTGRSHQIRVHLAEIGHPLLGDTRYGGPEELDGIPLPRVMLHSWRLLLPHPVTGEPLELEAPLPADLEAVLSRLRQSARPDI